MQRPDVNKNPGKVERTRMMCNVPVRKSHCEDNQAASDR